MLAIESKNRTQAGRCFSSSKDPAVSDQWEAPYVLQVGAGRQWGRGRWRVAGGPARVHLVACLGWLPAAAAHA